MKRNNLCSIGLHLFIACILLLCNMSSKAQLPAGTIAPDFTAIDRNGVTHNLYNYLNQGKYVMLKFGWFGCGSCDLARPAYNNIYHNYGCNQKDLIVLEIDPNTSTADATDNNILALFTSLGNPMDNSLPVHDSTYLLPKAPYITADGGGDTIVAMYMATSFTSEVIIEPINKTILGSTGDIFIDSNNVGHPLTVWASGFESMIFDGYGPWAGTELTATIESQLPSLRHYVPSAFMASHIASNPAFQSPFTAMPYESYCSANFSGCDTLKPKFTNYTILPSNDTARSVQINWTTPNPAQCSQYSISYAISGGMAPLTNLISSGTSLTLNLIPGDYDFYIKCACNQQYGFDIIRVKVKSDTSFVQNECPVTCNYRLVIYEDNLMTYSIPKGSWGNSKSRMEITAGGIKEIYLIGSDDYRDTVNGIKNKAAYYNLKFCKGDSIALKFYELGFGSGIARIGFKLFDDNSNIVQQYFSDTTFATGFPGYTEFSKFASNCIAVPNGIADINNFKNNFSLSPNPNSGIFKLTFNDNSNEQFNLKVYDIYGKVLFEKSISSLLLNQQQFDLHHLSKGVYFLKIQDVNGHQTQIKFNIL